MPGFGPEREAKVRGNVVILAGVLFGVSLLAGCNSAGSRCRTCGDGPARASLPAFFRCCKSPEGDGDARDVQLPPRLADGKSVVLYRIQHRPYHVSPAAQPAPAAPGAGPDVQFAAADGPKPRAAGLKMDAPPRAPTAEALTGDAGRNDLPPNTARKADQLAFKESAGSDVTPTAAIEPPWKSARPAAGEKREKTPLPPLPTEKVMALEVVVQVDPPAKAITPANPEVPAKAEVPTRADTPARAEIPVEAEIPSRISAPAKVEIPTKAEAPAKQDLPARVTAPPTAEVPAPKQDAPGRPAYGHTEGYRVLMGQVQQWRRTWRLRYAALESEDPHGGSVTLLGGAELDRLREGQHVRVRGLLLPADDAQNSARYQVDAIEPIE